MSLNSREELRELFRTDPEATVQYVLDLQTQREQLTQELLQTQGQMKQTQADLCDAKAFIAQLTRQLFGPKAEKLSPEQEEQLQEVASDWQEQGERPPPISRQCLEEELEGKKPEKKRSARKRHPFPINLERLTVTLEPDLPPCPRVEFTKRSGRK